MFVPLIGTVFFHCKQNKRSESKMVSNVHCSKNLRNKYYVKMHNNCPFCDRDRENITHLFLHCNIVARRI